MASDPALTEPLPPAGYDLLAIAFHWVMAALLLALLALGWYMVSLPDVGYDTWKITLILAHKAVGVD